MFSRLKHETQSLHSQLELSVDIFNRLSSMDQYRLVLSRFYGFYSPLEKQLALVNGIDLVGFDVRKKAHLLRQDLQTMGIQPDEMNRLSICEDLPDTPDLARALGCLYVLEGATLGGQIISRQLLRQGIDPDTGGAFFNSYGDNVGTMWLEFKACVEQQINHAHTEAKVIEAAQDTFSKLNNWFQLEGDKI